MIFANLDVEQQWAVALDPHRPALQLPAPVRRRISALGTLLRVLALPGERIWTPEPVDPGRIALLADEPEAPALVSGALPEGGEVRLCWGEPSGLAARLNHRAFGLAMRDELGHAIPGARMVTDVPAETGSWLFKAPLSAAGRDRVRVEGEPTSTQRRAILRLLGRFGELLLEPWLDRIADFGCAGWVSDGEIELLSPHRLDVDAVGRFRGIESCDDAPAGITECARRVGERLKAEGYRGPFGVDACLFRDSDATTDTATATATDRDSGTRADTEGETGLDSDSDPGDAAGSGIDAAAGSGSPGGVRLQPLLEINARMTFGHVAHALFGCEGEGARRFAIGNGPPPPGSRPLLLPAAADATSAWLEGV